MTDILPSDINAEQATIGSVFIKPDVYYEISQFLDAEDFYLVRHKQIWRAFNYLSLHRQPIDFLTVTQQLEKTGLIEEVGGASYLTQLLTIVVTSSNAVAYAKIVKQKHLRRELITSASTIAKLAFNGDIEVEQAIGDSAAIVQKVAEKMSYGSGSIKPISQLAAEHHQMTSKMAGDPETEHGIKSGLADLDLKLGGHGLKKKFVLLAGRPGAGKTSLALQWAIRAARDGKKVAIFSLDMDDAAQITNVLISIMTGIDNQCLEAGKVTAEEALRYRAALDEISILPIYIDDTIPMTISGIRARCLTLKATYGLDLVIIDYMMLIEDHSSKEENDRANLLTRGLKLLKKELDCALIVIHHMNRAFEKRSEGEPMMSDLNEGGEKDPDIIMFVYEPKDVFAIGDISPRRISLAKHRGGSKGIIHSLFKGSCTTFLDAAREK